MQYLKFAPLALILFAFAVYFVTKPPSILWIDSGTMIAASASAGIPNPPGFPFYMMASHFFGKIMPFGSYLFRLELFTIIFSLLLLFLVYKIILLVLEKNFSFHSPSSPPSARLAYGGNIKLPASKTYQLPATSYQLPALFGTISLAFSYQYWSQTLNTEAFIFSYFFVTLFAYLLLRTAAARQEKELFKTLAAIAFLFGLAAGANPTVASMVPPTLFVMYLNRKALTPLKIIVLGLVFLITLTAVYSYLPIRASTWPFVNWGNPQTWELFVGHLHGKGLDIYEPQSGSINGFTGSPIVFAQSVSYFFLNSAVQFTPLLVPFLLLGMFLVFKKNRLLFLFLVLVPLFDVIYSGLYLSGNQESWFILSWIFFAVFIGLGFYYFVTKYNIRSKKLIFTFSLCALPFLAWLIPLNRSSHHYSSDYAYNLYSNLEPNAVLIGTGDFFDSLSHYLHSADIFRPDVTPLTANVFYVNQWSRDGLRHSTNLSISKRIDEIIQYKKFSEYNEAMNQFISENIDHRPIYVTHLTLRASALAATDGGQLRLDDRFKFLPAGLSLKVIKADDKSQPNQASFDFKFKSPLEKKPIYLERNYRGAFNNILNDYVYSYETLADWFADKRDDQEALKYYQKALEVGGENAEVYAHLGHFWAQRGDLNAASQYWEKSERRDVKNIAVHFNLGLIYANLGKINQAKMEFEAVKRLAPPGDPIIIEAENTLRELSAYNLNDPKLAEQTASWTLLEEARNGFMIKLPPGFKQANKKGSPTVLVSNEQPGNFGLNIEIIRTKLTPEENIEEHIKKSPLLMIGTLLDVQPIKFLGYTAAVQVFGTPQGDSSQRFILIKGGNVWQFKVYPGSSTKLDLFYNILSTFKPI